MARWRRALLVVYTHPSDGRIAAFGEAHSGSAAVSAANAAARAAASDVGHSPFAASSSTVAEAAAAAAGAGEGGADAAAHSPRVVVWDIESATQYAVLGGFHAGGVAHVAFSHSGDLLATVGLDADHSVAVYVRSLLI